MAEETVVDTVPAVDPAPSAEVEKPKASKRGKKSDGPKEAKKRATAKPRTAPSHPPYFEMIAEAIKAHNDRKGMSQYAIAKFVEDKQKDHLPANFKKLLLVQLRKLVAQGKLSKIKGSFKIASKDKAPSAAAPAKAPAKKPASVLKPKKTTTTATTAKAPAKKPKVTLKPKPKVKPAAAKPKAAVTPKKTTGVKRKAPATRKAPVAKAAKTTTRSTPRKAAGTAKKPVAVKPKAKTVKSTKAKPTKTTKKSPAKRPASKRTTRKA